MQLVGPVGILFLAAGCSVSGSLARTDTPADFARPSYVEEFGITSGFFFRKPPEARKLVVFVHGYGGHPFHTWGRMARILIGDVNDGIDDKVNLTWTEDVHVFLHTYPATLSGAWLEKEAARLKLELQIVRGLCNCSEVYLIAHSVGALLVTRVAIDLLSARANSSFTSKVDKELFDSIRGVVLISPPFYLDLWLFRGSDWVPFGELGTLLRHDLSQLGGHARRWLVENTVVFLAADDAVIDNSRVVSVLPGSEQSTMGIFDRFKVRQSEITTLAPGVLKLRFNGVGHSDIVKVPCQDHIVFLAIKGILLSSVRELRDEITDAMMAIFRRLSQRLRGVDLVSPEQEARAFREALDRPIDVEGKLEKTQVVYVCDPPPRLQRERQFATEDRSLRTGLKRAQASGSEQDTFDNLRRLAALYQQHHRYSEAEGVYREAIGVVERAVGPEHPSVAVALSNLADLYHEQDRYDEAESLRRRALAIFERTLPATHPNVVASVSNLAVTYHQQGRLAEAETLYRRALSLWQEAVDADRSNLVPTLESYAALLREADRGAEASLLEFRARTIRAQSIEENFQEP